MAAPEPVAMQDNRYGSQCVIAHTSPISITHARVSRAPMARLDADAQRVEIVKQNAAPSRRGLRSLESAGWRVSGLADGAVSAGRRAHVLARPRPVHDRSTHTLFTWVYRSRLCRPISRPKPDSL
jgi:hypothetical protein